MKFKTKNILFIAGGSASDPILHSQGLPLLQAQKTKTYFISYEKNMEFFFNYNKEVLSKKYQNIEFFPIHLNGIFPLGIENVLKGVKKAISIYYSKKINIIHCRSLTPSLVGMFTRLLLLNKVKLIYDNRGVVIEEEIFKKVWKEEDKKVKIFRALEKGLMNSADKIVVVSEYFKKYLIDKYVINEDKIISIPNRTNVYQQEIVKQNKNIKVVYSGSTSVWQKINTVLELFRMIKNKYPEIECTVLTYRPEEVKKILGDSELNEKINIVSVDSKSVRNELVKHNIGLLLRDNNLINNVASPIKFGEYLAAGLPILISKGIGDTENYIKKFNIGVVTDNKDIFKDFEKLKSLIENDENIYNRCLSVVEKEFNLEISINDYNKLYESVFTS